MVDPGAPGLARPAPVWLEIETDWKSTSTSDASVVARARSADATSRERARGHDDITSRLSTRAFGHDDDDDGRRGREESAPARRVPAGRSSASRARVRALDAARERVRPARALAACPVAAAPPGLYYLEVYTLGLKGSVGGGAVDGELDRPPTSAQAAGSCYSKAKASTWT